MKSRFYLDYVDNGLEFAAVRFRCTGTVWELSLGVLDFILTTYNNSWTRSNESFSIA